MIYDSVSNYKNYMLDGLLAKALEHCVNLDANVAVGRVLSGTELYADVSEYMTKPIASCLPEAHRKYIDVQVVLQGREYIGCYPEFNLATVEPYDAQRDIEFFERTTDIAAYNLFKLTPGYFMILFPWDKHAPQIACGENGEQVKKIVYKVLK